MATTAPATVPSPQMVFLGEYHQSMLIEIKVAGRNYFRRALSTLFPILADALSANAGSVIQFRRYPYKQFFWNRNACAPARTLMTVNPAELTVIRTTAKRAKLRLQCHPTKFLAHLLPFRRPPNFSQTTPPIMPIIHAPGSGTTETASICVLPLSTSIRRKLALCRSTLFPLPSRAHDKSKPVPPAEPP